MHWKQSVNKAVIMIAVLIIILTVTNIFASAQEQWPSSMAGVWDVTLGGNQIGELAVNSMRLRDTRVSQNGSSVMFQTHRSDGEPITWNGQYSAGRLNATANYSRIWRDYRINVSLTMTGEIDYKDHITGNISGTEQYYKSGESFTNNLNYWITMTRIQ